MKKSLGFIVILVIMAGINLPTAFAISPEQVNELAEALAKRMPDVGSKPTFYVRNDKPKTGKDKLIQILRDYRDAGKRDAQTVEFVREALKIPSSEVRVVAAQFLAMVIEDKKDMDLDLLEEALDYYEKFSTEFDREQAEAGSSLRYKDLQYGNAYLGVHYLLGRGILDYLKNISANSPPGPSGPLGSLSSVSRTASIYKRLLSQTALTSQTAGLHLKLFKDLVQLAMQQKEPVLRELAAKFTIGNLEAFASDPFSSNPIHVFAGRADLTSLAVLRAGLDVKNGKSSEDAYRVRTIAAQGLVQSLKAARGLHDPHYFTFLRDLLDVYQSLPEKYDRERLSSIGKKLLSYPDTHEDLKAHLDLVAEVKESVATALKSLSGKSELNSAERELVLKAAQSEHAEIRELALRIQTEKMPTTRVDARVGIADKAPHATATSSNTQARTPTHVSASHASTTSPEIFKDTMSKMANLTLESSRSLREVLPSFAGRTDPLSLSVLRAGLDIKNKPGVPTLDSAITLRTLAAQGLVQSLKAAKDIHDPSYYTFLKDLLDGYQSLPEKYDNEKDPSAPWFLFYSPSSNEHVGAHFSLVAEVKSAIVSALKEIEKKSELNLAESELVLKATQSEHAEIKEAAERIPTEKMIDVSVLGKTKEGRERLIKTLKDLYKDLLERGDMTYLADHEGDLLKFLRGALKVPSLEIRAEAARLITFLIIEKKEVDLDLLEEVVGHLETFPSEYDRKKMEAGTSSRFKLLPHYETYRSAYGSLRDGIQGYLEQIFTSVPSVTSPSDTLDRLRDELVQVKGLTLENAEIAAGYAGSDPDAGPRLASIFKKLLSRSEDSSGSESFHEGLFKIMMEQRDPMLHELAAEITLEKMRDLSKENARHLESVLSSVFGGRTDPHSLSVLKAGLDVKGEGISKGGGGFISNNAFDLRTRAAKALVQSLKAVNSVQDPQFLTFLKELLDVYQSLPEKFETERNLAKGTFLAYNSSDRSVAAYHNLVSEVKATVIAALKAMEGKSELNTAERELVLKAAQSEHPEMRDLALRLQSSKVIAKASDALEGGIDTTVRLAAALPGALVNGLTGNSAPHCATR